MKPFILKEKDFLKFFRKLKPQDRLQVIPLLQNRQINLISEICKNFLHKNLTQNPKIVKQLRSAKNEIRVISLKRTPISKKKKILQSRQGGAILTVLLPLAASVISSLLSKRK